MLFAIDFHGNHGTALFAYDYDYDCIPSVLYRFIREKYEARKWCAKEIPPKTSDSLGNENAAPSRSQQQQQQQRQPQMPQQPPPAARPPAPAAPDLLGECFYCTVMFVYILHECVMIIHLHVIITCFCYGVEQIS